MLTVHDSKQKVVTLQIKELFFLAGILGSDRLLGVEDPFRGYMAEDIAKEWERVKTSLLDKGYLIQDQDSNELIMTPTVFSRVAIAGLSDRACWLRYTIDGKSQESYIHCTDERVVEVARATDVPDSFRLSDLGNVREAIDVLIERMKWSGHSPVDKPALMCSKKKFYDVMNGLKGYEVQTVADELSQETNDPEGSLALARCLVGKQSDGELRLLVWGQEGWQSQSAAFTASAASNWLFRMSTAASDDWLVAALTTKEQFHEMLLDWLKQPAGEEER
ncbi:hypothetical protein ABIE27_002147 [Paenibacillus sp. 4624]|uniref:ESX secretion-associated protein EspG n=1 Tax=Paenibacillus amylolyticus TaxID=1451 RepID=A0A5M9X1K4_PAEAM|nr:hypothetical protein [Paenibacillus amylolyticus]KAA8787473.1 hypothetical protein EC604_26935 [Paenibacillus amylolyticus]